MSRRTFYLVGIALALAVVFLLRPKPCREPITYRFGQIDPRFGLTSVEFAAAVNKAAAIWAQPLSRELFREDPEGAVEISFVYDYRQEAADKLKQLNIKMDYSKESHDHLKERLERLRADYDQHHAALDNDLNAFHARLQACNAEIESWNRRGGAPENERRRLTAEKDDLQIQRERLSDRQNEARQLVEEINSLVIIMNEIVAVQNLDVGNYREVGSRLGGEFQEGYFEQKNSRRSITVYHYHDEARLVRLLVHELGHALRLGHLANKDAVMYRINQSDTPELTPDDIAALKAICGVD
jgi:type I site-specific restriction endonuclease